MPPKSVSKTPPRKSRTVAKQRAERFLLHLANLRGAWPLNEDDPAELKRTMEALDNFCPQYSDVLSDDTYSIGLLVLREFLRKAWDASNARQREWYIYGFRDFAQKMTERVRLVRSVEDVPVPPLLPILPATFREAAEFTAQSEPSILSPLEMVGFDFAPIRTAGSRLTSSRIRTPENFAQTGARFQLNEQPSFDGGISTGKAREEKGLESVGCKSKRSTTCNEDNGSKPDRSS